MIVFERAVLLLAYASAVAYVALSHGWRTELFWLDSALMKIVEKL